MELPGPLEREEEQRLIRRYREGGDITARNKVIEHNLKWAVKMAYVVAATRPPSYREGLIATAIDCCFYAAETMRPIGVKFTSYLSSFLMPELRRYRPDSDGYGRQLINRGSFRVGRWIRPGHVLDSAFNVFAGVKSQKPRPYLNLLSLDTLTFIRVDHIPEEGEVEIDEGEELGLWEGYIADEGETPEDCYERKEAVTLIMRALGEISRKKAKLVRLYYGIGREGGLTLKEIGRMVGLSHEKVRQLIKEGEGELRYWFFRREIARRSYTEEGLLELGCWRSVTGHYVLSPFNELKGIDLVFENRNGRWSITHENSVALGINKPGGIPYDPFFDETFYYFLKFEKKRRKEERRRGLRHGELINHKL